MKLIRFIRSYLHIVGWLLVLVYEFVVG